MNIRQVLEITQDELARRTGINATQISHYETGSREPTLTNIVKICNGLGCKPGALIPLNAED